MKFPKNNEALDKIFTNGSLPELNEFKDEYWVSMLTGMIPSFRWAGHRKRFYEEETKRVGVNIVLVNMRFGYFKVESGACNDLNGLKVVILNYRDKRNPLTRSIKDCIRKIEENVYLGRYYVLQNDEMHFKGYFSLIKRRP